MISELQNAPELTHSNYSVNSSSNYQQLGIMFHSRQGMLPRGKKSGAGMDWEFGIVDANYYI